MEVEITSGMKKMKPWGKCLQENAGCMVISRLSIVEAAFPRHLPQ
jgi:hypothetical protein